MTQPVNPPNTVPVQDSPAPQAHTDPVVQNILSAGAGLSQLADRPLVEIAEQLDALHGELQTALADVDKSSQS